MQPEGPLEAEGGVGQGRARFGGVHNPWAGVDENSRPTHRLRLVGMEHRNAIETALQGAGRLSPQHRQGGSLGRHGSGRVLGPATRTTHHHKDQPEPKRADPATHLPGSRRLPADGCASRQVNPILPGGGHQGFPGHRKGSDPTRPFHPPLPGPHRATTASVGPLEECALGSL